MYTTVILNLWQSFITNIAKRHSNWHCYCTIFIILTSLPNSSAGLDNTLAPARSPSAP